MDYKIEYNRAIEFISAVYKYANSIDQQNSWSKKELEEDISSNVLDFAPTKEVKDWLAYISDDISPFLRSDIVLLVFKMFGLIDSCYKLVINNNLQDYCSLMEKLRIIEGSELIELIYENYDTGLPFTSEDKTIKEKLSELYSADTASYFIQAKRHPDEYKNKVIKVFETFYNLYYKSSEDTVYSFMDKKCKEMNETFKHNFIGFVNTTGIGDYSKLILENKKFRVFVSYYIDLGMFNFYNNDTFIMFCGYSTEQKFNSKTMQEKTKELFKALADDKRLEILKVATKRSWYNKELADYFDLSPATLSYHINLLLDLGVLNFEPSINNRYYYKTNVNNLRKIFEIALKYILN